MSLSSLCVCVRSFVSRHHSRNVRLAQALGTTFFILLPVDERHYVEQHEDRPRGQEEPGQSHRKPVEPGGHGDGRSEEAMSHPVPPHPPPLGRCCRISREQLPREPHVVRGCLVPRTPFPQTHRVCVQNETGSFHPSFLPSYVRWSCFASAK